MTDKLGLSVKKMSVKKRERNDFPLRGYKLTVSTKFDVSDETVGRIVKYVKKNAEMAYVVIERGDSGVRHLHALLCLKKEICKRNLEDYVWRHFVSSCNEGCQQKWAVRADVLYDSGWRDWYLSKEEGREVIYEDFDDGKIEQFYPSSEIQARLQAIRDVNNASDSYIAGHADRFKEWNKREGPGPSRDVTRARCLEYFYWRMYGEKDMKVVMDPRRVRQMAGSLYRYVTSDLSLDFEDRKWVASHDGPVFDFRG